MKKVAILCLAVSLLSSGCGTTQPERTGAIVGGAAIGNSVGGAIGGLVGDSRHGWRGSYRGSAIGSIVGTLAGAAIGGALTAPKSREENRANPWNRCTPSRTIHNLPSPLYTSGTSVS